jgi:hypothetical protein
MGHTSCIQHALSCTISDSVNSFFVFTYFLVNTLHKIDDAPRENQRMLMRLAS